MIRNNWNKDRVRFIPENYKTSLDRTWADGPGMSLNWKTLPPT